MAKVPPTDLGTKEIYKRHSIMVEGGLVPRARVMDQNVVDALLMRGELTLSQHRAAEMVMEQAARSGIYAKAPDPIRAIGGVKNAVPTGIFALGRTLKLVERQCSPYHAYLVQEVVCQNWDISDRNHLVVMLQHGLQAIADRYMMAKKNPVRHLRRNAALP